MARRPHTAARAGYQPETQEVVRPPDGLTRHYVLTRHGAVRRVWMPGPLLVEVALWRPRLRHAQYQGIVTRQGGVYVATIPTGQEVARTRDYIDAEAALLPLRNRHRSYATRAEWPEAIRREMEWRSQGRPAGQCGICGHTLAALGAPCQRPDLHW